MDGTFPINLWQNGKISYGILKGNKREKEICETLGNIQNKLGGEEIRLWDHIVRIIVLLDKWSLKIEQGFCMGTKDNKHPSIKRISNKASYLQQFNRNSRDICFANQYLKSIGLDSVEQQWRSIIKQKSFKRARTLLNNLESLQTILEEHWKSICQPLTGWKKWWFHIHPWMIKCKMGQYPRLFFLEISLTVNILLLFKMIVVLTVPPNPFSNSPSIMLSSHKVIISIINEKINKIK